MSRGECPTWEGELSGGGGNVRGEVSRGEMSYTQCIYLHNLFQVNNCVFFCLNVKRVFAESYVKLQYFVTVLSLVTLPGSECTHAR